MALARAFRSLRGVRRIYVADLDAVQGGAPQRELLALLARELPGGLMLDAGITDLTSWQALALPGMHLVVGLETLRSMELLAEMCAATELTFSLDLRNGLPLGDPWRGHSVTSLAAAAVAAGARSLLVLDLGRVGEGRGVDTQAIAGLHRQWPEVELLVGGGVRADDLASLASSGCNGVLVATALHRGELVLPPSVQS